ncbi:serine hydrolase domain-containing protein [Kitasatospora cineracea]|uniref:serine hydrolase domain-containing protein n=1 Tax=Kitasatospora cineracea TaxID=88074 RepID=UPI0033E54753
MHSSNGSSNNSNNDAAVRELLERAVTRGGVPGILVEVHDGDRTWHAGATVGGQERSRDDRFRIGSITKTFVATVVLQLAAEGRIVLDAPVVDQLSTKAYELPRGVTVRRLLDHTSGLPNYTDHPEELNSHPVHRPEVLLRIAAAHPPRFAPGTGWAYSNTNYVLAGLLVEQATGQPLAAEIQRRICRPLGLTGTHLPGADEHALPAPHARHWTKLFRTGPDAPVLDATELDPAPFWAAGAMVSTAPDLNRFLAALLSGRLLRPAQQRELLTTVATRDWIPDTAYGLGICSLAPPGGGTYWGMGGAVFGSWTYAFTTADGTRLLTANTTADWTDPDSGWADPIALFTDLLRTAFGARP